MAKNVLDNAAAAAGRLAKSTVDNLLKRVSTDRIKEEAAKRGLLDNHVNTLSPSLLTQALRRNAPDPFQCFTLAERFESAKAVLFATDLISDAELMDAVLARVDIGDYIFQNLAVAHKSRAERWHVGEDGVVDEWSVADWFVAMMGELGEAANVAKKLRRLKGKLKGNKPGEDQAALEAKLALEIADFFHYSVLLANAAGVDYWAAIRETFNAKSEEFGFPERL